MIYDEGVERENFDSSGLSTGEFVGTSILNIESAILSSMKAVFLNYGNRPLSELDMTDFRTEMLMGAEKVQRDAIQFYRDKQQELVGSVTQSVTNGFQVGVLGAKRQLEKGGKGQETSDKEYSLNDSAFAREALTKAQTSLLQAEAKSVESAANKMLAGVAFIVTGAFSSRPNISLYEALDEAIIPETADGLTGKVTTDGRELSVGNYAEGLTRETSQQALLAGEGIVANDAGFHYVRISEHQSSCPLCQPYQGKILIDDVWSNGRADGKHELLSVAKANGLFHWNCRHTKTIWYPGAYEPSPSQSYDPKKVAETYRLEQIQRNIERNIRRYKRVAETALTTQKQAAATAKVAEWQAQARTVVRYAQENRYQVFRQSWKEQAGYSYELYNPYNLQSSSA